MKKITLILVTIILIVSCKDKTASNLETMKKEFETYIKDRAFADNGEVEIFQLDAISYDTISENYIDTLKLYSITLKINRFEKLVERKMELAKLKGQETRLIASLGDKTLVDIGKEDVRKYGDEAIEYLDSIQVYAETDSLIREKIKSRNNPKDFYEAKFFIKATAKVNGKSENILDTLNVYFNDQLKIIDLKK